MSSPTCADDIALLTNKQADAQILTNVIDYASSMDRFTKIPIKSEILVFKTSKRTPQNIEVVYKQNTITQVISLKHIGIERNQSNTPDIAKRIETARKTLYALLGSDMHDKNGISPAITYQMWITFVIPRLLLGMELLDIRKQKRKRGMFDIQKSGNKTGSGDIIFDIRTHASPKMEQDQVFEGVSVLCLHAISVAYVVWKPLAIR